MGLWMVAFKLEIPLLSEFFAQILPVHMCEVPGETTGDLPELTVYTSQAKFALPLG